MCLYVLDDLNAGDRLDMSVKRSPTAIIRGRCNRWAAGPLRSRCAPYASGTTSSPSSTRLSRMAASARKISGKASAIERPDSDSSARPAPGRLSLHSRSQSKSSLFDSCLRCGSRFVAAMMSRY